MNTEEDTMAMRSNYQAWDIEPLLSGSPAKEDLYRNLVGWAILAPNSHNVQPWRFILRPVENIIDVCLHGDGVLPASDKKGRQAYISIGCAIENILIAAEYYGVPVRVEYLGEQPYPSPAVRLRLGRISKLTRGDPAFLNAIKTRRMNRSKYYSTRPVPESILERIHEITRAFRLVFNSITDKATRAAIAQFQYFADKTVVARTEFRHELACFMLPNDTREGKGMPGNTFGLNDDGALKLHGELKKDGPFDGYLAEGFTASSRDGIRSSPLLGVISVGSDRPEWWIKAGRAFQKIALLAEVNDLSIAMHAAIVEVEMFNKLLRARLKRRQRPTVIFRVGYATEDRPHSPRVNVEEVVEVIG